MLLLTVIIVLGYLIGSLPNSIIAGKVFKGIDIREHGSRNAGAANAFRVLGWKAGVIVGLLDLAKGFIAAVFIARIAFGDFPDNHNFVQIISGLSAVFGHIWTIFAGFKGGKGVLTAAGMLLGLMPGIILICTVVFGIVFFISRYVSLGSIAAALTLAGIMLVRKLWLQHEVETSLFIFSLLISVLLVFTHRSNIKRLINGTENRIAWKNGMRARRR